MQYATDTCHAALYGKPTADTLFRYFNKCVVLRAIGKIIKVNNERINVDLFVNMSIISLHIAHMRSLQCHKSLEL